MAKTISIEDAERMIGTTKKYKAVSLDMALLNMVNKTKDALEGKVVVKKKRSGEEKTIKPRKVFSYDADKKQWALLLKYGTKKLWAVGDSAGSEEDARKQAYNYLIEVGAGKIEKSQKNDVEDAMKEFQKRGLAIATGRQKKQSR